MTNCLIANVTTGTHWHTSDKFTRYGDVKTGQCKRIQQVTSCKFSKPLIYQLAIQRDLLLRHRAGIRATETHLSAKYL